MKRLFMAIVAIACVPSLALADGLSMSLSKLGKLGLSSMRQVDDVKGSQVRGSGFGSLGFSVRLVAGPNAAVFNGALAFGQDPITIGTLRTGDLGNVDATNTLVPFTLQFSDIQLGVIVSQQVSSGFGHIFSRGSN